MPITLTCVCGERISVATDLAGQCVSCAACGNDVPVPAMGVRLQRKAASRQPQQPSVRTPWMPILAVGGVLMLLGMGVLLAWAARDHRNPVLAARTSNEPDAPSAAVRALETPKPAEPAPIVEPEPPLPERPLPKPGLQRPQPITPTFELAPKLEQTPPPATVPEKMPAKLQEFPKLAWKLKEADTFYQELIVTQSPTFKMQGAAIKSLLQYRIVSRFDVQKRNADGSLVVRQKIESAKLLQADDLTRASVAVAIAKMPGTIYTLELSPGMEVTQFQAGKEIKIKPIVGGQGLRMASLLDRDGWKELDQATFFQMDQPLKINARWTKPMTHAWGALGSWTGNVHYTYAGPQGKLHKITYTLQMKHQAPAGGKIGVMTINGATFQAQDAGGVLLFDAEHGKVVSAEERFRVKGIVNVSLLGQNTVLDISEDQHFQIRVHDKNPDEKD